MIFSNKLAEEVKIGTIITEIIYMFDIIGLKVGSK
jgi:hypothetical protein